MPHTHTPPQASENQELNATGKPLPSYWKRTIAIIWCGQAVSILATFAATFAAMWYITTSENSAFMLALAGVAALLPIALFSPFGGVISDRANRKHVMIAADGIAGVFSFVLALIVLAGNMNLPLLLALLAARSTAQAFHGTSLVALMPELVPERHMVRINTLDQVLSSSAGIFGPVLGILLYTFTGLEGVLFLDAACAAFACLCLALAKLPYAKSEHTTSQGVISDFREGITVFRSNKGLKGVLLLTMIAMLLFLPLGTLSPLMTYGWFGGDGFQTSLVEAVAAIGLLIGSAFMFIWGGGKKLVNILIASGVAIGIACIACGLLPQNAFPAFVVLFGVIMAATAMFNAPIIPLIQKRVPVEKFGRIMGIFTSFTALATPIGLFIAGPAAEALSVNTWFVVAGILLCIAVLLSLGDKNIRSLDDSLDLDAMASADPQAMSSKNQ